MSLSSPHLGCELNESVIVNVGFKILRTFKKCQTLRELDMDDHKDFKQTCLYKLSKAEGLNWF